MTARKRKTARKRPGRRYDFSRWASMLFSGVILLSIGMFVGMQIEAQRRQAVTAQAIPERIVFDQPQVAKPARMAAAKDKPATARPRAMDEVAADSRPRPAAATTTTATVDRERVSHAVSAFSLPDLPPFPPQLPAPVVAMTEKPAAPAPAAPAPAAPAIVAPEPKFAAMAPPVRPTPSPPSAQLTPASLTSLPAAGSGWRRNALAAPRTEGRAMIAVVIDDLGVDRKRSERIVALPGPLTTAFMSYARDVRHQSAAARANGHELMLHMPMEPQGESYDPGPDVLTVGLPAAEIRRRVADSLGRFDGLIGLNNHMGSRFTENTPGMRVVMEELSKRGLMFLDSMTTAKSVGLEEARRHGVTAIARDIFLDNEETVTAVTAQLVRAEVLARKQGYAVAIGHPRDATIDALAAWIPTLKEKGLILVPISTLLRRQAAG